VRAGPVDRDQVRRLYEQHGRILLAYACVFVADRSVAEDVLHQVFVKLLRGNARIPDNPVAYLCRAVRNTALNLRRDHAREVSLGPEAAWLESPPGLQEVGMALEAALQTLPEEQREIIVLRIWGGMSFDEASTALDISPNTAASRYRYGLAKLREQLKPL
jgi:RNA polymerase sigma-70 factor (ECF subfamily)